MLTLLMCHLPIAPPPEFFSRYVELNPDPKGVSDRVEWVYMRYNSSYDPCTTFDMEIQWMVATISILHTLVSVRRERERERAALCCSDTMAVLLDTELDAQGLHVQSEPDSPAIITSHGAG